MPKVLDTTRVPGRMPSKVGRNCSFNSSSKYRVTTLALEKSSLKMSPCTMRTRPATGFFGIALRQGGEVFVVLNAPSPRPKLPCRRDRDLAVTGPQVHHLVFG
jgi:hypothetical protein